MFEWHSAVLSYIYRTQTAAKFSTKYKIYKSIIIANVLIGKFFVHYTHNLKPLQNAVPATDKIFIMQIGQGGVHTFNYSNQKEIKAVSYFKL